MTRDEVLREEPAWLGVMAMAAREPLMKDQQVVPIINDGTIEAVYTYIVHLRERLAAVEARAEQAERERDEARRELWQTLDMNNGDNAANAAWTYAHMYQQEYLRAERAEHRAERMEKVCEAVRAFVHCERTDNVALLLSAMGDALRALDTDAPGVGA